MAYGDIYLLSTNPARISRWNGMAWSIHAASLPTGATHVRDLAIDPSNGDILTIDDTTEAVYRWNGTAWSTEISVWPSAGVAEGITFDGDGNIVVAMPSGSGNGIFRWDGTQWNFVVSLGGNSWVRLDTLADGSLYVIPNNGQLWRIDESEGTVVWGQIDASPGTPSLSNPGNPTAVTLDPNTGDFIAWSSSLSQFRAWNVDAWVPYDLSLPDGVTGNIQGLAFDRRGDPPFTRANGEILALARTNRRIYRRRGTAWRIEARAPSGATNVRGLGVNPVNGTIALADDSTDSVYLWDGSAWATQAIPTGRTGPSGVAFDAQGRLWCAAADSTDTRVFRLDDGSWTEVYDATGLTTSVTALWLSFTSSGELRAFSWSDRRIYQRNSDDNAWESASDQITLNSGSKPIEAFAIDKATDRGVVYNNEDLEEWDGTSWSDRLAGDQRPNFGTGLYETGANLLGLAFDTYTPVSRVFQLAVSVGEISMTAEARRALGFRVGTDGPDARAVAVAPSEPRYGNVLILDTTREGIYEWDGTSLTERIADLPAGYSGRTHYDGIAMDPVTGEVLFADGDDNTVYRWDGDEWLVELAPADMPADLPDSHRITDIAIDPATEDIVVALSRIVGSGGRSRIYRWNGSSWSTEAPSRSAFDYERLFIAFDGDGVLNAADQNGRSISRYVNGSWESTDLPDPGYGIWTGQDFAGIRFFPDGSIAFLIVSGSAPGALRWTGLDWQVLIPQAERGGNTWEGLAVNAFLTNSRAPLLRSTYVGGIRADFDLTQELAFAKSTGGPEARFSIPRAAFRKSTGGITSRFDLIPEISLRADTGGVSMDVMIRGPLKWSSATGGVAAEASLGLFEWISSAGGPSMAGELTPPMGWKKSTGGVSMEARMTRPLKWEAYAGGPSVELPLWIPPKINASTGRISADIGLYQPPPVVPAPDGVRAILQNHDTQVLVTWNPVRPRRGNITGYDISLDDGDGEVVTFTGRPDLSAVLPVSHGTIVVKVRGRTVTHIGEWSKPVPVVILRIRLDAQSSLVIGQWQLSQAAEENIELAPTALRKIIDIFLGVMRDYILGPISQVGDQLSVDKAEGVWLDYLGARVGLVRPESYNAALDDRFGFDQSGQPFDAHPFLGVETSETVSFPIADDIYRRIVKARGIAVLSDGNFWDFARAVRAIDSTASISDKQNMTVRVVTDNDFILRLADTLGALPRPAGVQLVIAPRGQFGYDESGVPFDQGPFA